MHREGRCIRTQVEQPGEQVLVMHMYLRHHIRVQTNVHTLAHFIISLTARTTSIRILIDEDTKIRSIGADGDYAKSIRQWHHYEKDRVLGLLVSSRTSWYLRVPMQALCHFAVSSS